MESVQGENITGAQFTGVDAKLIHGARILTIDTRRKTTVSAHTRTADENMIRHPATLRWKWRRRVRPTSINWINAGDFLSMEQEEDKDKCEPHSFSEYGEQSITVYKYGEKRKELSLHRCFSSLVFLIFYLIMHRSFCLAGSHHLQRMIFFGRETMLTLGDTKGRERMKLNFSAVTSDACLFASDEHRYFSGRKKML